ncbi:type 1 fimbrial protein [Providencia stuartii]|uniref:fimbrial protein n=2 Tax=Providencia TaxID=586 RepID=UPI00294105D0|nr:type 1 fimbrial protein [Providencia stuartii]ELR5302707.1 type 1 fimbrial protein [Providencia stuartii]MDW7588743.1 fimbrial protein [Providencia sp. 2023EL-00965]
MMAISANCHRYSRFGWVSSLLCLSLWSGLSHAADRNATLYRPDGNWNVEGASGQLYVFGSLTESPCRIAMESMYQSVDMGNIETADLKKVGQTGRPVPFHIELLDCIETPTALRDIKTGSVAWSSEQPGVKMRFLAPSVPFYPQLARVVGVQGLGLQLSDEAGRVIPLGESSVPRLLSPGQDSLSFFITPVRIASDLQAGAYRALISFELMYD